MRGAMALVLGLPGCGSLIGIDNLDGPFDASPTQDTTPLPECKAQRAVHLVAGNGGLAWFTLEWPLPAVINNFQVGFAYDNPALATQVSADSDHPLFARQDAGHPLWQGLGKNPQPSAYVAGTNETHTTTPSSTTSQNGISLGAAGATMQATALNPMYPLLLIGGVQAGTAPGAPLPVAIGTAANGPGLFPANIQSQVQVTPAQLARYVAPASATVETELASTLAFSANAFKLNLLSTVMSKAFNDDPHGAFDTNLAPMRADDLAKMLDAFYADLAGSVEPNCGHAGRPLSLADNTVVIVVGDTPKDSFQSAGWPDGTTGGANFIYVRSNGFTKTGWFGAIDATTRTNFDPTTGQLSPMGTVAASTAAAFAGTLYAIARGDRVAVTPFTTAPYDGVVGPGQ
jgi:hypothetical protein